MTQLNHWQQVNTQHSQLVEFLDWLTHDQGVRLDWTGAGAHLLDDEKPERLIDKYLKVDRAQLDRERRELLDQMRESRVDVRGVLQAQAAAALEQQVAGDLTQIALNSDASMTPDTARALHRVVRAMHDGNCPSCGALCDSSHMRMFTHDGWKCPRCEFAITEKQAAAAMVAFRPVMAANLAVFEEWRKCSVPAAREVTQADLM